MVLLVLNGTVPPPALNGTWRCPEVLPLVENGPPQANGPPKVNGPRATGKKLVNGPKEANGQVKDNGLVMPLVPCHLPKICTGDTLLLEQI